MHAIFNRYRAISFALFVLVIAGTFYLGGRLIQNNTQDVNTNTEGIRVGCVLLSNIIIDSQGSQRGSVILVQEILRNAEQHHRAYVKVQYLKAVAGASVAIKPPNCKRIAEHPEDVVATPVPVPAKHGK